MGDTQLLPDVLLRLPEQLIYKEVWQKLLNGDRRRFSQVCRGFRDLTCLMSRRLTTFRGLSESDLERLMLSMQQHSCVCELWLVSPLEDGVKVVRSALQKLQAGGSSFTSSIKSLYFAERPMTSGYLYRSVFGCSSLAAALPCVLPALEQISLWGSTLPSLDSWGKLTKLVCIQLIGCVVPSSQIKDLAKVPSLRTLHISEPHMDGPTPDTLDNLVHALATLTSLRSLSLHQHVPTLHYVSVLSTLTGLTRLSWSIPVNYQITDTGAMNSLSALTGLLQLHLPQLNLGDQGVQGLAALQLLTQLQVGRMSLTSQCPPAAMSRLRSLGLEHLDENHTPPAMLRRLLGDTPQLTECAWDQTFWDVSCSKNAYPETDAGVEQVGADLSTVLSWPVMQGPELQLEAHSEEYYNGPVLAALAPAAAPWLNRLHLHAMLLSRACLQQLSEGSPKLSYLKHLKLHRCTMQVGALLGLLPLIHARPGDFELEMYFCYRRVVGMPLYADVALFCTQVEQHMVLRIGTYEEDFKMLCRLHALYPGDRVAVHELPRPESEQ